MIDRTSDIREEKIFLIAYVLWMIDAIVGITMWNDVEIIKIACDFMQRSAYILLVIQFLLKKQYTKKDVIGVFLIIFICFLGYHSVYNKYIIHTMILVYMSANVDFRKILRCTLVLHGAFMIITIYASHMEVIENVIWDSDSTRIRQSLGYDYCGYPAHIMLFMTLAWFCLRKKAHFIDTVILFLINFWIYCMTDSRADFYLALLAILGFVLKKNRIRLPCYMKYGFVFVSFFSIIIHGAYGFGIGILDKANSILSNRLYYGFQAIRNYRLNLFGTEIRWVGQGGLKSNPDLVYNYVDCAYVKEIYSFGIIFWILLMLGFYFLSKRLEHIEQNKYYSWAILITLFYSVINAHLSMVVFDVMFLLLGNVFSNTMKIGVYRDKAEKTLHFP